VKISRTLVVATALGALTVVADAQAPATQPAEQATSEPMSEESRQILEKGLRLFGEKNYQAALAEFEQGYALEPRREFLFAMAQAERLRGNCPRAIDLYRHFLATKPTEKQIEAARSGMARCLEQQPLEATVLPTPRSRAGSMPQDSAKPLTVKTDGTRRERRKWTHDVVGHVLLGAGVASLAVGGLFYVRSSSSVDDAHAATAYDDYQSAIDDAQSQRTVAVVGLLAGTALVAGAVVHYFWYVRE
jgi:tetratricopeptide (TPR) repeat protein